MLSCFRTIFDCFNYSNTFFIDKYDTQKNNDKYIIIDNNIYVECNICFEVIALQNIRMFYPCCHRLYCDLCIKNVDKCPLCRKDIKEKLIIYENFITED